MNFRLQSAARIRSWKSVEIESKEAEDDVM